MTSTSGTWQNPVTLGNSVATVNNGHGVSPQRDPNHLYDGPASWFAAETIQTLKI